MNMRETHPRGAGRSIARVLTALLWLIPGLSRAELTYRVNNGTIEITRSCPDSPGAVTIPETIDGLPVTRIGDYAFENCSELTSITIPKSVISIGDYALSGCSDLSAIEVDPANLSYSSESGVLFNKNQTTLILCPSEKKGSYIIPGGVITIGNKAFENCSELTIVGIPDSVITIGYGAFKGCTSLTNVTLPDDLSELGSYAFEGCTGIESVSLPDKIVVLRGGVFMSCQRLRSVRLPAHLTSLDHTWPGMGWHPQGPFFGCQNLASIVIPSSVTNIGGGAFAYCTSLNKITLPGSVRSIGDSAFFWCKSLTNIAIPDSVVSVEPRAFRGCTNLTGVTVGIGATLIGRGAFADCSSLITIQVDPANSFYRSLDGVLFDEDYVSLIQYPGGRVGSYVIPDGVARIGDGALSGCWGLNNVMIPPSVTSLGEYAFGGCESLTTASFRGNAPSTEGEVFNGTDNVTLFHLPGTTGWGPTFGDRPTTLWVLPQPVMLTTAPGLGVQPDGFGFRISWATNTPVVVDASTRLSNPDWSPVSTNTLVNGWSDFRDPQWASHPHRFYRVRSP